MIVVSGRLQIRKWTDKDGNKRSTAEIVADNCYFGDSKSNGSGQSEYTGFVPNDKVPEASQFEPIDSDDSQLPF
jgi:single-strand DNA-binding protein